MTLNPDKPITFAHGYRLQWEEAQKMSVLLYPEGMVELNRSSAAILQLCDGKNCLGDIVAKLEQQFSTSGLQPDITNFLQTACKNGWITQP